jgi:hypothetical protein
MYSKKPSMAGKVTVAIADRARLGPTCTVAPPHVIENPIMNFQK